MLEILKFTGIGLFFGTFGTTLGGIIGINIKSKSNRVLGFMLSFSAGLMLSIICFDLISEVLNLSNLYVLLIGLIIGIGIMIFLDEFVNNFLNRKVNKFKEGNSIVKTGVIIGIGLALHNIPEGLAIGSGFGSSIELGVKLAIAICFHDIPEGIAMAVPLKNGGINKHKVVLYVILSGLTTGLGSFVGSALGGLDVTLISLSLSLAAGCMLYIVSR